MDDYPKERDRVVERDRRTSHVERYGGGTGIAAVVGALVVAVLVLFWLFSGDSGEEAPALTETDVTVEETETAAEEGAVEETVGTGAEAEQETPLPEAEAEPESAPETEAAEPAPEGAEGETQEAN